jgi:hypothetical protein
MYCPSCGVELAQEMSYCNRCGANLKPAAGQAVVQPQVRSVGAAWAVSAAVGAITLGGFALIFALVMTLVSRGIKLEEGWLALIIAALVTILLIDWLLIRQLPGLIGRTQAAGETVPSKEKRKLSAEPVVPQLVAPREPAASVTDHTTRTFDPIYRERDTQR